ncbi:MAG: reductive dehalogenase [Dehalogenimonas sp.]
MSIFHSTISRRDFMKNLGVVSAGIGAASLAAPAFNDLDGMMATTEAEAKRPWWIKKLDLDHPTVEIDWEAMQRYDCRLQTQVPWVNVQYAGKDAWLALRAKATEVTNQYLGKTGSTIRDIALQSGSNSNIHGDYGSEVTFTGKKLAKTPEQVGLPKWTGTPEENTRMLRSAASFFGAARIGISELGTASHEARKLVYTYFRGNASQDAFIDKWPPPLKDCRRVVMEDVDPGFDDGEVIHVPNKELWKISVMIPHSKDAWRCAIPDAPSGIASAANTSRYRNYNTVKLCLQDFLRGLGYMGYGTDESGRQLVPSEASAVLGGTAEMSRHSDACIDPEYGANMGYWTLVTDLPLAPDNPIDAGIFRFCHTCHKCADACPSSSISQDSEATWDVPNFGRSKANTFNNPGKKLFWTDMHGCQMYRNIYACRICRPVCTFHVNSGAMAHQVIKATLAVTPIFNGVFWSLAKPFGYGLHDSEEWWSADLPTLGYDSTIMAFDGGYKK